MDNRVFRINGTSKKLFSEALKLAFLQHTGGKEHMRIIGYAVDPSCGIILQWHEKGSTKFPCIPFIAPSLPSEIEDMIWNWLSTDAANVSCPQDDDFFQGLDGSTGDGWEIYNGNEGHFPDHPYAIVAIRKIVAAYGK